MPPELLAGAAVLCACAACFCFGLMVGARRAGRWHSKGTALDVMPPADFDTAVERQMVLGAAVIAKRFGLSVHAEGPRPTKPPAKPPDAARRARPRLPRP